MNLTTAPLFTVMLFLGTRDWGPRPLWQPAVIEALYVVAQSLTMIALSRGDVSVATPVMGTKVVFVAVLVTLIAATG